METPFLPLPDLLLYDSTFDGLLTAVFEAYARKLPDARLETISGAQLMLDGREIVVETCPTKAGRVLRGILRQGGQDAYEFIYNAFITPHRHRGTLIYRFIRLCMFMGRVALDHYSDPTVMELAHMNRQVAWELQHLLGFVRLTHIGGGIYFGVITPDNDLLDRIAPHFADRFRDQHTAIHDKRRGKTALCAAGLWEIHDTTGLDLPENAADRDFIALWRRYFGAIDNPHRRNLKLQRQHVPKRYWKHMDEMSGITHPEPQQE